MILPKEKVKAKAEDPRFLILFGKPKSGKTTLVANLENNLIIDLEGGSEFMDALAIQARTVEDLGKIASTIKTEMETNGGTFPYKYITIDSGTILEDIIKPYALKIYQRTPQGKKYEDDILKLPNGAGYMYLREAFEKVRKMFQDLCESFILICHCKDSMINKEGKEISEMSIDLAGKLGRITMAAADAIGYVYRNKNQTIVNFNGGGDTICEARAPHLRGKEVVIAESDSNNDVHVDWTKIYLQK